MCVGMGGGEYVCRGGGWGVGVGGGEYVRRGGGWGVCA